MDRKITFLIQFLSWIRPWTAFVRLISADCSNATDVLTRALKRPTECLKRIYQLKLTVVLSRTQVSHVSMQTGLREHMNVPGIIITAIVTNYYCLSTSAYGHFFGGRAEGRKFARLKSLIVVIVTSRSFFSEFFFFTVFFLITSE